ncbi:calcium-activated chloride channel regulator 1-like [Haemaphysalis longicornis]
MGKRCYCLHECSLRSQFFPRLLQTNPQIPLHILQESLKMLRLVITALVIAAAGTIHIDTTDGGYEGVTVSIHHSVPFNEAIVENLKEMFRAASIFLHHATNGSVYFKSIRIEFPISWPKRDHARAVSSNSYERSDVRINLPTETTGDAPFTEYPGICGEIGYFIQLTPRFLAQTRNMTAGGSDFTAYVFVHEWAHLRYGVFDEFGSLGDAAYPPLYCQNGSVWLNGCSKNFETVENVTKCIGPNCTVDPSCKITPRISRSLHVESSIMFLPYMGSDVKYFCDDEGGIRQHNYKAPSRQNALCKQRSTWDVIKEHADFKNLAMPNRSKTIQVNFEEVQQKELLPQRVVLVLDASISMREKDRLKILKEGVTSYVQHIKDNTWRLAIVTFSWNATTVRSLMMVNGTTRRGYLEEIEKMSVGPYTCIGCGLERALQELTSPKESAEGGVIVLVTDGEENKGPMIKDTLPKLVEAKAVVSTVGLASAVDEKLLELAVSTGGKAFTMRDSSWPRDSLLEEFIESTTFTKNDNYLELV